MHVKKLTAYSHALICASCKKMFYMEDADYWECVMRMNDVETAIKTDFVPFYCQNQDDIVLIYNGSSVLSTECLRFYSQ